MSESDAPEPESPANSEEVEENAFLFGIWDISEMEYTDPSVSRYIKATPIAHTMGRRASKQLQKSEANTVGRLISRLVQIEGNTGHKQKTSKIVKSAFEIVNERTEESPAQMPIRTVRNADPHEEAVRLEYGGISVPQAVGVAPQRHVDKALKFITQGTFSGSYKATTTAVEALTQQLIGTAGYNVQTYVISQEEERERVAEAAQ